jgi:O-antigen/teichoic acid export membrane protein
MTDSKSSYRSIAKATSIFGGVQVINILISIIRSKFVAILLGPTGMGITGLLTSTVSLIQAFTNFGLSTSSVREIALAVNSKDPQKLTIAVNVSRRMMWLSGLLGAGITFTLAPMLSYQAFGGGKYTVAFIWLSVTLLLNQISEGQLAVLQGLRKFNYLARSNIIGSSFGLITAIPLYYVYGLDGIVPSIVLTSLTMLLITKMYLRKVNVNKIQLTLTELIYRGRKLLSLGFLINMSGLIGLGSIYVLRIYIGRTGGLEDVGYYVAGYGFVTKYAGIIFQAMSKDYLPRLSALSNDNEAFHEAVNRQKEILVLLISPFVILLIVSAQYLILVLYSEKFLEIILMLQLISFGMFFRATSWSMGFIPIAKGDGKIVLWNSLGFGVVALSINILGYKYGGISGLGLAFLINNIISTIHGYIISRVFYQYKLSRSNIILIPKQLLFVLSGFLAMYYLESPVNYLLGLCILTVSIVYSYWELDSRLALISLFKAFFHRRSRKR